MYSYSFKEEFGSVLCYDSLLAGYQYGHLRKSIHDQKYTVITMLDRKEARQIVHGDGFLGLYGSKKTTI